MAAAAFLAARAAHAADPSDPELTATVCVSCAELFVSSMGEWLPQATTHTPLENKSKSAKKREARIRQSVLVLTDAGQRDAPLKGNSAACNAFSLWLSAQDPPGPGSGAATPANLGEAASGIPLALALVCGHAATLLADDSDVSAQGQLAATIKASGGVQAFVARTHEVRSVETACALLVAGGGRSRAAVRGLVSSKRSRVTGDGGSAPPTDHGTGMCASMSCGDITEGCAVVDDDGEASLGHEGVGSVDVGVDVTVGVPPPSDPVFPTDLVCPEPTPPRVDDALTPHFGRLVRMGPSGCTVVVKVTAKNLAAVAAERYPVLVPMHVHSPHRHNDQPSMVMSRTLTAPTYAVPAIFGGEVGRGPEHWKRACDCPSDHPIRIALRAHNTIGSHPCVLRCVDAFLDNTDPHLLMEFVPGSWSGSSISPWLRLQTVLRCQGACLTTTTPPLLLLFPLSQCPWVSTWTCTMQCSPCKHDAASARNSVT